MEYLRIPLPPNQCCMDFDMSIKVTRNNIERGRGVGRANKALIPFQQAALTRKSDFPGECLNNFANACGCFLAYFNCCMAQQCFFELPYNHMVWQHIYTAVLSHLNFLLLKHFSKSPQLFNSSTQQPSPRAAKASKCTKHSTIQKGSVQCNVGAIGGCHVV